MSTTEELYLRSYGFIVETALQNHHISALDAERIATGAAAHLSSYTGPVELQHFQTWLTEIIAPAVAFYSIHNETRTYVYAAISRVLATCEDLGADPETADEVAADVWLWLLAHLDEMQQPGPAKLTSRLYARGRWAARAWKKTRLREREKFVFIDHMEEQTQRSSAA